MKKKYIIAIVIIIVLIVAGVGGFFFYKSQSKNKGLEKANELISQREYSKALAAFELVLDDDLKNQEAMQGKEMMEDYIDAENDFNKGDLEEASKEINKMPSSYLNYSAFKEDVDKLKNKINEGLKTNTGINNEIDKIRDLINNKKYDEAKKLIDKIEKENLSDEQKKTVEDLNGRIKSELEKSQNNNTSNNASNSSNKDMALDRTKYINKLNNIQSEIDKMKPGETTAAMHYNADETYKAWDNALNEIYNDLKANLPKDQFNKLQKEEVDWIKEKEEDAKEEANEYKGGTIEPVMYLSTLAKETKERCYELVNEYMK